MTKRILTSGRGGRLLWGGGEELARWGGGGGSEGREKDSKTQGELSRQRGKLGLTRDGRQDVCVRGWRVSRCHGEGDFEPSWSGQGLTYASLGRIQVALVVKNPSARAGDIRDLGLIPGLGRSPGGEHGSPLQYSFLENPMDRGAWQAIVHRVAKSQSQLKWLSTHVDIGSGVVSWEQRKFARAHKIEVTQSDFCF